MKFLVVVSLITLSVACMADSKSAKKTLPVNKAETAVKAEKKAIKEADCDTKAKQPIEIKPETISLSGNTGCSLDEIKN